MKIDDWTRTSLDYAITSIQSGSRPKGGVSSDIGEVPSLGGENLTLSGKIELHEVKLVHRDFYKRMTKEHLKHGDVLINKDGAQTGKVGFYTEKDYSACINEHLFLLRGHRNQISQKYLYYSLLSQNGQLQIRSQISGSAQPGLKAGFIKEVIVDLPQAISEQAKIAEILTTVDHAIEQTEALIAKQQRIKTGLMQDLLTHGIDEQGNLRSEKTHLFKDSPLGRIPVEWEVDLLNNLLVEKHYGISTSLNEAPIGIPILRMNNLVGGEVDLSNLKFSTGEDAKKLILNDGDVLFNRTNSIDYVGRTGIYRQTSQLISFASYLVRLVPNRLRLHPEYLNLWLNSASNQIRVKQLASIGVQQANVNPTNLGSLLLAIPGTIKEQNAIINAISASKTHIYRSQTTCSKLLSLKTALMQDLLTGRKRVTALLPSEEIVNS